MRLSTTAAWLASLVLVCQLVTSQGARPSRAERLTSKSSPSSSLSCRLRAEPLSVDESRVLDPDFTFNDLGNVYLGDSSCNEIPNRALFVVQDHEERQAQAGRDLKAKILTGWADSLFASEDDLQQQQQFSLAFRMRNGTIDQWEAVVTVHDKVALQQTLNLCQRSCKGNCGSNVPAQCLAQLTFVPRGRHVLSSMSSHFWLLQDPELTPQGLLYIFEVFVIISAPMFCWSLIAFARHDREDPELENTQGLSSNLLTSVRSTHLDLLIEILYTAFCTLGAVAVGAALMMNNFGGNRIREKVAISYPAVVLYKVGQIYLGIFRRAQLHTALLGHNIVFELDMNPTRDVAVAAAMILVGLFISSPAGIGDAVLSMLPLAPGIMYVFLYLFETQGGSRNPNIDGTVSEVPSMKLKHVLESRYKSNPESYDQEMQQTIELCRPSLSSRTSFMALLASMMMFLAGISGLYTECQEAVIHYCTFARGTLLADWNENLHTVTVTLDTHLTRLRLQCLRSMNAPQVPIVRELQEGLEPEVYSFAKWTTIYFQLEPGDIRPLHVQLVISGPKARPYNVHVVRSTNVGRLTLQGVVPGAAEPWKLARDLDDFINMSSIIYAPLLEPRLEVFLATHRVIWGPIAPVERAGMPARSAAACLQECRDDEGWLHCAACEDLPSGGGCIYLRGDGEAGAASKPNASTATASWCTWDKGGSTLCSPFHAGGGQLTTEFAWLYAGNLAHQRFLVRMQSNTDSALQAQEVRDVSLRVELALPIPQIRFPLAMQVYSSSGFPVHDVEWGADVGISTSYMFALGTPESLAAGISMPPSYSSRFMATVSLQRGRVLVAVKARNTSGAPWCADWCDEFQHRIKMPLDGKSIDFDFVSDFDAVLCKAVADASAMDVSTLIAGRLIPEGQGPRRRSLLAAALKKLDGICIGHRNLLSLAMDSRNDPVVQFILDLPGLSHELDFSVAGGQESMERAQLLSSINGLTGLSVVLQGLLGTSSCMAFMRALATQSSLTKFTLLMQVPNMDQACFDMFISSLSSFSNMNVLTIDYSALQDAFASCPLLEAISKYSEIAELSIKFGPASTYCSALNLSAVVPSWGGLSRLKLDYERTNIPSDAILVLLQALAQRRPRRLATFQFRIPAIASWNANMSSALLRFVQQPLLKEFDLSVPGSCSDPTIGAKFASALEPTFWRALNLDAPALYTGESLTAMIDFFSNKFRVPIWSSGPYSWYFKYVSKSNFPEFESGMQGFMRRVLRGRPSIARHNIFLGSFVNNNISQAVGLLSLAFWLFADLNITFAPTPPIQPVKSAYSHLVEAFHKCHPEKNKRIAIVFPEASLDDSVDMLKGLCAAFRRCTSVTHVSLSLTRLSIRSLKQPFIQVWNTAFRDCLDMSKRISLLEVLLPQEMKHLCGDSCSYATFV